MKKFLLVQLPLFVPFFSVDSVTAQCVSLSRRLFATALRTQLVTMSLFLVLLTAPIVTAQSPLGSEWTYQGRLVQAGSPLNDTADFEFSLHDAASLGNPVSSVITVSDVQVVNGLFTVQLDFGVNAFQGDARWLEINVRSPHDPGNADPFTPLDPRQPVTAAPYSLQTRGIFVDDLGKVGIGTASPNRAVTIQGNDGGNGVAQWLSLNDLAGDTKWHLNHRDGGLNFAETLIADNRLFFEPGGNVGIGTGNPHQRLTVAGGANFENNVGINNISPHNPLTVNGQASITGNLGIGVDFPTSKLEVVGDASVDGELSVVGDASVVGRLNVRPTPGGPIGGEINLFGQDGSLNCVFRTFIGQQDQGMISVHDQFNAARAGMLVNPNGQGEVYANVKNFRADNPADPSTEIWYASLEGPEAAAYVRGTAVLVNGQVTIPLPEHFAAIAVSEGMTVQLTPRSADSLGLAEVESSVDRIVVRELLRGNGTYEFDWRVVAVRKGFENYEVIRPRLQFDVAEELSRDKEGMDVESESELATNEHDGAAIANR